jgi:hypothetical protein
MRYVLDSSVALKWVLAEADSAKANQTFHRCPARNAEMSNGTRQAYPAGWSEARVRRLAEQYNKQADYDIEEHRHRFAAWAAARATQRGLTSVEHLCQALNSSGLRKFLAKCDTKSVDETAFDRHHGKWCRAIVRYLRNAGIKPKHVTFGRAAKLVAVYLKSMIVLGPGFGSALCRVAHPPIDSILLFNLTRSPEVVSPHKHEWAALRWTSLEEPGYYRLIKQLRDILAPGEPFWMLERFWKFTDE